MGNPVHIWSQCGDWLVRVDFRKWGSWFWFWFWFWFSWQWCGVGVLLWSLGVWVYLWTDADAVYCTVTWPAVTECKLLDDDNAGLWMNDGSGRIALFFLSFFHCLGSWCGWKSEWRTWLGLCLAVSFQHQRSSAPVSWFCFALCSLSELRTSCVGKYILYSCYFLHRKMVMFSWWRWCCLMQSLVLFWLWFLPTEQFYAIFV